MARARTQLPGSTYTAPFAGAVSFAAPSSSSTADVASFSLFGPQRHDGDEMRGDDDHDQRLDEQQGGANSWGRREGAAGSECETLAPAGNVVAQQASWRSKSGRLTHQFGVRRSLQQQDPFDMIQFLPVV